MTPNLELREVRKSYGDFVAVDSVSFAVPPGSVFGLLGQNGAGKTTSLRMIMDILAPDRGEVHFFGRPRKREDLHKVALDQQRAGIAFDLFLQVRNKMVSAYQEVMRMQV